MRKKNNKLLNEFWEYDQINENGFEKIIDKTLNFNIKRKNCLIFIVLIFLTLLFKRKH